VSRSAEQLSATAALLEGTEHHVAPFDLTAIDEILPWLKKLSAATGPLHGLVHSAGTQSTVPLRFLGNAKLEEMLRLNLNSAVALSRGFLQKGVCGSGGSIVFVASVRGIVGTRACAAYAATKGALIAVAKSLAIELAPDLIRVNCIAPGLVRTDMADALQQQLTPEQFAAIVALHPLGLGLPADIANAAAFLLADTGRWITGSTLIADGGYTAQ
jgi:NAD(P)-dependent dehydrogenase (short-subunit alcohol dehydrogenase family)